MNPGDKTQAFSKKDSTTRTQAASKLNNGEQSRPSTSRSAQKSATIVRPVKAGDTSIKGIKPKSVSKENKLQNSRLNLGDCKLASTNSSSKALTRTGRANRTNSAKLKGATSLTKESNSDMSSSPKIETSDNDCGLDRPASIQACNTSAIQSSVPQKDSLVFYHDDEEINHTTQLTSSDEYEYFESGTTLMGDGAVNNSMFVVQPLGCCEIDETKLMSSTSSKAIQKCILSLLNRPPTDESLCWGLDQSEPVLMNLLDDHIQFTHLTTRSLLRSQPIKTIKTWAVDDDNNFAFVVEERAQQTTTNCPPGDSVNLALLSQPTYMCYVFSSMDDDDMSCKVAAKLNEEISRFRQNVTNQSIESARVQQMVEPSDQEDADLQDEMRANDETTLSVKYVGMVQVPRPTGIDILNVAIDECIASAGNHSSKLLLNAEDEFGAPESPFIDAKLHVSPSNVIVENELTGEIIVECRIRYLTFMGISRRDIRWCAFIMQNTTKKNFEAHCFECAPTASKVCEAIQTSCASLYEKVVKSSQARQSDQTLSIIPSNSKIRDTLAKTFSKIRLNPLI